MPILVWHVNLNYLEGNTLANSRTTVETVDGKKHGYWITYYASGSKRSEGNYIHDKKDGLWIYYHKNGNKSGEESYRDGKHEGECMTYHENGNIRSRGTYPKHVGKSYDGKKEGAFYNYEEDGETVWLIITYKKGGSRAKPDEYPLGTCHGCGEVRRLNWGKSCPKCDTDLE